MRLSNPQPAVNCPGSDFWVDVVLGPMTTTPISESGEVLYDSDHLAFSGYSVYFGGPNTVFTLTTLGHLAAFLDLGGAPNQIYTVAQLHFTRRTNPMAAATIFPNVVAFCNYPNGDFNNCSGLESYCENGGSASYTP
jgi:hypothetical protein